MVSENVNFEFGLVGDCVRVIGGQNTSIKYNDIIVKPVDDIEYYIFAANIMYNLKSNDYRISRPIKSKSGKFVVDGYAASHYEKGEHDFNRTEDILKVSKHLHKDLSRIKVTDNPVFNNPWAKANDVLWRDREIDYRLFSPPIKNLVNKLLSEIKPIDLPCQLIHADLGGNVLFDDNLPPLVIDFSPTYAPYEYANAIILCDNIAWNNWSLDTLKYLGDIKYSDELCKYAVAFRVLSSVLIAGNSEKNISNEWKAYCKIWDFINNN